MMQRSAPAAGIRRTACDRGPPPARARWCAGWPRGSRSARWRDGHRPSASRLGLLPAGGCSPALPWRPPRRRWSCPLRSERVAARACRRAAAAVAAVPVPAAFLVWTGPLRWWIWAGTLAMLAARLCAARRRASRRCRRGRGVVRRGRRVRHLLCAAWHVSAVLPGERAALPGHHAEPDLGRRHPDREQPLRGTTARTSRDAAPDYLRRGQNGQIYSIHAPASPRSSLGLRAGGYPEWSSSSRWCRPWAA